MTALFRRLKKDFRREDGPAGQWRAKDGLAAGGAFRQREGRTERAEWVRPPAIGGSGEGGGGHTQRRHEARLKGGRDGGVKPLPRWFSSSFPWGKGGGKVSYGKLLRRF